MLNKSEIYTSSVRTHIPISTELLKTERQWALAGYIAINNNCDDDKAHDSLADCLATLYCYNKINDKK